MTGSMQDEQVRGNYDVASLWVTRLISRGRRVTGSPLGASAVLFGVGPALVMSGYVVARGEYLDPMFVFSLLPVVVLSFLAPYLVWYYDSVLFPTFCANLLELFEDERRVAEIAETYQSLYCRWWWVGSLLAAAPIPLLAVGGRAFFEAHGLFGVTDVVFWLVLAVLLWVGVFVGIGFLLVVVSLFVVRDVSTDELRIDPFHPDGLGGMSVIGHYAIRTTMIFSVGSLLIPLQLRFAAATGNRVTALIYAMAFVYAAAIALSFVYPTLAINRRADDLRADVLADLRDQYLAVKRHAAEPEIGAAVESTDSAVEQKLQRIRQEYQDYNQVRLYPLELTILFRLVGSVLLPLVFIVIDTLLDPTALLGLLHAIG